MAAARRALILVAALLLTAADVAAAELPPTPEGYEVSAKQALRAASGDGRVAGERRSRGALRGEVEAASGRRWEVGFFDRDGSKVALAFVDGTDGIVLESFTGAAVAWPMARGREGQFGHVLNAPWVWLPLALLFLAGLFDWRRPRRLVHLDLLVLLLFGISLAFFNEPRIGLAVALWYPPLLYLLGRALWIGFRGLGAPLRPSAPVALIAAACLVLIAFRITINVVDSGVIDVGYAGVIGADRIVAGEPIYGEGAFPDDNPTGDTYGPAAYFAYVPFELALPWSGGWDSLPAARAAAISFDLLCVLGLCVLGLRLGGRRLAATLAFAWLAFPFTTYVLQSNSNDALLAALLIWSLALFASPAARGILLAAAALTKFAPLALVPLYAAGRLGLARVPGGWARARPGLLRFSLAFAATAALLLAHPAIDPGLPAFWERTIGNQAGRDSPFSAWGQLETGPLHALVLAAVAALSLAVAFVPSRRHLGTVAALTAAVLIAVQLTAQHWFYLYIVWFLPALLVALAYRPAAKVDP